MLAVSVLCLAILGCLLCTTDAVITAWTTPVIATKDGNAALVTKVAEDLVPGTTSISLVATKDDVSGSVAYAITSQPASNKLTINSASGLLSLATGKSFDFETETTYVFVVTASIAASTGTATVTLSITDVNEYSPVFKVSQYRLTMADGATAATAVTTVKATDADASSTLTYSITAGNTNTVFAIDSSTGAITVAASKTVDLAGTGGYTLTVTGSDGTKTGTTTVVIADKVCSSATTIIAGAITVVFAMVALML